ncbi:MAG TPA: hypothetical protein VJ571_06055 [Candidatus Nitrosotalea sp.]|nr:hypothetical protein [Candidatus Nitrosotalea sp.]
MKSTKSVTFKKLFVMLSIVAIFASVGSAATANAQTGGTYPSQGGQGQGYQGQGSQGQGHTGQQFSGHGNFTGHQGGTRGSQGHMGNYTRSGTANGMNSFNRTKTGHMPGAGMTPPVKPVSLGTNSSASNATSIPSWVKSNAKFWSQGQVADSDFIQGLQYLIQNGMIKVPATQVNSTGSQTIPSWVKSDANYWSTGQISDDDFIKSVQYLISAGIIKA